MQARHEIHWNHSAMPGAVCDFEGLNHWMLSFFCFVAGELIEILVSWTHLSSWPFLNHQIARDVD